MKVGLVVVGALVAPALANMNVAFEVDAVEALYARADTEHSGSTSSADHIQSDSHSQDSTHSTDSSESSKSSEKTSKTDDSTSQSKSSSSDDSSSQSESSSDDNKKNTAKSTDDNTDSHTSSSTDKSDTAKVTSKAKTKVTSSKHHLISVDPRMPQGAVVLVEPTSTSTTYIKSGQNVTFKWTYTNLINSPSGINIEAHCSSNMQTYTLARNMSPETKSVVWNTGNTTDNGEHLITAEYTLIMYDSNLTASAVASAGSLGSLSYIFGVYQPQKYVPWPKNDNYISKALQSGPGVMAIVLGVTTIGIVSLL